MTKPQDCPFCQLDSQPERIVRKNEHCRSFLSNPRLARGHALVIPNRHVETPDQINSDEYRAVFDEVRRLQAKILGSIAPGVDLWQKTRPSVRQGRRFKVDHVHFHVLPSNPGDELYDDSLTWTKDRFADLNDDERDEMVELLK